MENLSVYEQHQQVWYRKYSTLLHRINTTRDELKRLIEDTKPDPAVKRVRNVGINVCPESIRKEIAIANEITIL